MPERTEPPTARRLAEARQEGQVARSVELNTAAALLVGVWLLRATGQQLYLGITNLMTNTMSSLSAAQPTRAWLLNLLFQDLQMIGPPVGMIFLGLLVTGVVVNVAQTGFLWASKRIRFDLSRLNPIAGLKRLISWQGLVEFLKALLKLTVVGYVAYAFLRSRSMQLLELSYFDLHSGLEQWLGLASDLAFRVAAAYLVLAIADYAYQRWRHMRSLRMTKEEVKEDIKRSQGDPFIRGQIKQRQRRMARMRMMANVEKADVVITNPTHLAVAVQYEAEKMHAPRILAKGAYRIAERIVELAQKHDIPIVQNIPLARELFRNVDIEHEIPPELYLAMAEVLAYVYSLRTPGKQIPRKSITQPGGPDRSNTSE